MIQLKHIIHSLIFNNGLQHINIDRNRTREKIYMEEEHRRNVWGKIPYGGGGA